MSGTTFFPAGYPGKVNFPHGPLLQMSFYQDQLSMSTPSNVPCVEVKMMERQRGKLILLTKKFI